MGKRDLVILSLILVAAAAVLHYAHYLIFHDAHQMLFYLVGDIAFLPLEVLFVTIIVDRMLAARDAAAPRRAMTGNGTVKRKVVYTVLKRRAKILQRLHVDRKLKDFYEVFNVLAEAQRQKLL